MHNSLKIIHERYPIAGKFTISRGSKTEAAVIVCEIGHNGLLGRGECVPYARYGESIESVSEQIEAVRSAIESGATRQDIQTLMPAGAARNAVDCAMWDLEAKLSGKSVADTLGAPTRALETAITVSLGTPEEMAESTAKVAHYPLIKVKMGGDNDIERIHAVANAAPNSRIIIDANEGWTEDNIEENMAAAAKAGVVLIEQPLPAGKDDILSRIERPVIICADESVHTSVGLEDLAKRYDAVNIKLDKAGGLTEGLIMRE
jgi:L-alanine-DL-glutamate epimerase-like enolase superfamily enzyme